MINIDNVIEIFSEEKFQETLIKKSRDIEKLLIEFIEKSPKKISKNLNFRIKNKYSLKEKLQRKNYMETWGMKDKDKSQIQGIICEKLPDLFGYRINCYFKEDEKIIFQELISFLKDKCIKVEENPNLKQKNGHEIHKISCKYIEINNVFSFEVQVNSLMHDTWGEVEHSIIYKNKNYDSRQRLKKDIIEGIYTILKGADKQLQKIYTTKFNKEDIIFELFSILSTSDDNEEILGIHYSNFFKLNIWIKGFTELIEEFIGKTLLGEEFIKKQIIIDKFDLSIYTSQIDKFLFDEVCKIAKKIYDFEDNDMFLRYIISNIVNNPEFDPEFDSESDFEFDFEFDSEFDSEFDFEFDFEFDDETEKYKENNSTNAVLDVLKSIMKEEI